MKYSFALAKIVILLLTLVGNLSYAHQSGSSYLNISVPDEDQPHHYSAVWKILALDLELALGLDNNLDGKIIWGELLANRARIEQFVKSGIRLSQESSLCPVKLNSIEIDKMNNGLHIVSTLLYSCDDSSPPTLTYTPMNGFDSQHKGLISLSTPSTEQLFILGQDDDSVLLAHKNDARLSDFRSFVLQGIWHILIGYDHLLFLLALLLPSVLQRQNGKWSTRHELKPVLVDLATIVSLFTLAHSITLIAATLQWIELSTRWVEIIIAASVAAGGIILLFPVSPNRRWLFVFIFGLVHGFGFANVLHDLTQSRVSFWQGTLGFNLGVEMGQLLLVLLLVPVLFHYRSHRYYRGVAVPLCAVMMIGTGSFWMFERSVA